MPWAWGDLKDGGIRICKGCGEVTLEDDMHWHPEMEENTLSVHDADYAAVKKELGIPEDEPIFVLRAQDKLAIPAIARYRGLAAGIERGMPDGEWFDNIQKTLDEFSAWQSENETKVPD